MHESMLITGLAEKAMLKNKFDALFIRISQTILEMRLVMTGSPYKNPYVERIMNILFNPEDLGKVLSNLEYVNGNCSKSGVDQGVLNDKETPASDAVSKKNTDVYNG